MVIPRFKFPFYGIIIVLSILIGMYYVFHYIKEERKEDNQVLLYFIMYISFAFIFGKIYTVLVFGKADFLRAGLSSYGGLVGVVIASIVFEYILPTNKKIIKYSILSLPLVYGLSKIACAVAGCCGGIPYEGLFKVKYISVQNIWQFPVQITETIVFIIIFIFCQKNKDKKNIEYITLSLCAIFKFLLDFLRYDHINTLITRNQIFSMALLLIIIVVFIYNKKVNNKKNS